MTLGGNLMEPAARAVPFALVVAVLMVGRDGVSRLRVSVLRGRAFRPVAPRTLRSVTG